MTTTKQAIPTEFMGVRFRSKSEAMFANLLEHCARVWIYEPIFLTVGDYTPDFVFFSKKAGGLTQANIVEYKPCKPTQAYFDRLAQKAPQMMNKLGSVPCSLCVMSINFFENSHYGQWVYVRGDWRQSPAKKPPDGILNSVRNYRYDLESNVMNLPQPQQEVSKITTTPASQPTELLSQFRNALSSVDGMLADYAGLAWTVEANENGWDVIFPPGGTIPKEVCEKIENAVRLKDAIFHSLGQSVNLKFSVMPSNLNKKFFSTKNEI